MGHVGTEGRRLGHTVAGRPALAYGGESVYAALMPDPATYLPVPVEVARQIAAMYGKSIVINSAE
jgi:hypothetical protein